MNMKRRGYDPLPKAYLEDTGKSVNNEKLGASDYFTAIEDCIAPKLYSVIIEILDKQFKNQEKYNEYVEWLEEKVRDHVNR